MTGGSILPSSMSLKSQARFSARAAHLDPVVDRQNLHVAVEQRVTRILFNNNQTPEATGVEVGFDLCMRDLQRLLKDN